MARGEIFFEQWHGERYSLLGFRSFFYSKVDELFLFKGRWTRLVYIMKRLESVDYFGRSFWYTADIINRLSNVWIDFDAGSRRYRVVAAIGIDTPLLQASVCSRNQLSPSSASASKRTHRQQYRVSNARLCMVDKLTTARKMHARVFARAGNKDMMSHMFCMRSPTMPEPGLVVNFGPRKQRYYKNSKPEGRLWLTRGL